MSGGKQILCKPDLQIFPTFKTALNDRKSDSGSDRDSDTDNKNGDGDSKSDNYYNSDTDKVSEQGKLKVYEHKT